MKPTKSAEERTNDNLDGNPMTGHRQETALDGDALNSAENVFGNSGDPALLELEAGKDLVLEAKKKLPSPYDMPDPRDGPTPWN